MDIKSELKKILVLYGFSLGQMLKKREDVENSAVYIKSLSLFDKTIKEVIGEQETVEINTYRQKRKTAYRNHLRSEQLSKLKEIMEGTK